MRRKTDERSLAGAGRALGDDHPGGADLSLLLIGETRLALRAVSAERDFVLRFSRHYTPARPNAQAAVRARSAGETEQHP